MGLHASSPCLEIWEEQLPLKTGVGGGNVAEYFSLLHVRFPVSFMAGHIFFCLPCPTSIPVEALFIILHISCQIYFQLCLGFPDPIPTPLGSIPTLFPGHMFLLPLSGHFPLVFQFQQEVLTQLCWIPTFLT